MHFTGAFNRIVSDSQCTSGDLKSIYLAEHFCTDTSVLSVFINCKKTLHRKAIVEWYGLTCSGLQD